MVDLDIDIWALGRVYGGKLDVTYLKIYYPYIETPDGRAQRKIMDAIHDHLERNHNDQEQFLVRPGVVFFQNKEDYELCRAALYIY